MQTEFLLLNDSTDNLCLTSILHPSQLLNDIIDIKQSGANTRKIYTPDLPDNARAYTYNFETHQVELDTILAVEHVIGEFDSYTLKSYKTSPVQLTNYDQIKTNTSRLEPNPKFTPCSKLGSYTKLLLQVDKYSNVANVDDCVIVASDDDSEIEIPMTYDIGVFIGAWLGNGTIRKRAGNKFIEVITNNEDVKQIVLNILQNWFPDSYEVTTIRNNGNKDIIVIEDGLLADWLDITHGIMHNKQIPSVYYSAPDEFINGLVCGLIKSTSKLSINKYKNVLYCTIASKSKLLIKQIIELLTLYMSVPASESEFQIKDTQKFLYIANIRVTDEVQGILNLEVPDDYVKFIPKSNTSRLNGYNDLITIMRPKLELNGKVSETFMFRMKNNNNIIGMNGLIYKAHIGLRL